MQKQLHPGAKWSFRLGAYASMFFLLVIAFIWSINGLFSSGFSLGLGFFIIVFVIIVAEIYTRLAYANWKYEFTDDNLKVERGIIWKRYSNIPYQRVQNVDIQRGIIARLLGFSSVNIQTAGYSAPVNSSYGVNAEGYIPAVDMKEAEEIRNFIMKKITKRGKSGL